VERCNVHWVLVVSNEIPHPKATAAFLATQIGALRRSSLKNHGADQEVNDMFDMGAETMALPLEEKLKFDQGDDGRSFGCVFTWSAHRPAEFTNFIRYKSAGANAVDASG